MTEAMIEEWAIFHADAKADITLTKDMILIVHLYMGKKCNYWTRKYLEKDLKSRLPADILLKVSWWKCIKMSEVK